jgi:uncharacterized protein
VDSITISIIGVCIGAVLGLTGAGGGMLAVPALVVGLGWTIQQSTPVALIAVALSAAIGAIDGLKRGLVRYKAAILMVMIGAPCTALGVRVAAALPQRWLLILFAIVMLIAAARLFMRSRQTDTSTIEPERLWGRIDPKTGRFQWCWGTAFLISGIGAAAGFMTGLLGVGGGFIIVPLLRRFTNVAMQGVVATSLMVIALVGSAGVVSAIAHGVVVPMQATAVFALAAAVGMLVGRKLASHVSEKAVQLAFAGVLVVVAVGILVTSTLLVAWK